MIRIETEDAYILLQHQDHARLAGEFARLWKEGGHLTYPEPFEHVHAAVARHDDSWVAVDHAPEVTKHGQPVAFTRELVGTYDAFEEIEFEPYLKVRGEATEQCANDDPYAAILVSMHTVNLLTEQADLSTLDQREKTIHKAFIDRQRTRQRELAESLAERGTVDPRYVRDEHLDWGFRFLQACDSLSLFVCCLYDGEGSLRHKHTDYDGNTCTIRFIPEGPQRFRLSPSPFAKGEHTFKLPCKRVSGKRFANHEALRTAYHAAPQEHLEIVLTG